MSAQPVDDWDGELPDDLLPQTPIRGTRVPVKRTAKQQAAAEARRVKAAEDAALAAQHDAAKAKAAQLAQIVNLHIAGYSFADIGASIGASADEIERMLNTETARYVRTQPALRTYVRNFISGKYTELLDTFWDRATDANHPDNFDAADRATRLLDRMARLHGAEAPVQKEVKVENSPEAVQKIIDAMAQAQNMGYDASIFDVIDGEVIHEAVEESAAALEVSGNDPDFSDDGEGEDL